MAGEMVNSALQVKWGKWSRVPLRVDASALSLPDTSQETFSACQTADILLATGWLSREQARTGHPVLLAPIPPRTVLSGEEHYLAGSGEGGVIYRGHLSPAIGPPGFSGP